MAGRAKVQVDELGPWIDLGIGGAVGMEQGRAWGAARPALPTMFELGELVGFARAGAGPLYALGAATGDDGRREAWLNAPPPKALHLRAKSEAASLGRHCQAWEAGWEAYLSELVLLREGNPDVSGAPGRQDPAELWAGRVALYERLGGRVGAHRERKGLWRRGGLLAQEIAALWEARAIAKEAGAPGGSQAQARRI